MALKPEQAPVPYARAGVSKGAGEHFGQSAGCAEFQAAARAGGLQFAADPSPLSQITSLCSVCVCAHVVFAH